MQLITVILCTVGCASTLAFQYRCVESRRCSINSRLNARVAKREEEQQKETAAATDDELVPLPFSGILGNEAGGLFDTPLNVFDPTKDTDDLPGTDGSDEKIAAIQRRIKDRVEELKKAGEWELTNEEFGRNPLAKVSLLQTMLYQIQICKPFESYGELGLTYGLVLATSSVLLGYLLILKITFNSFMQWYIDTDFELLNSILRNG